MLLDELKTPFRWYDNISYLLKNLEVCDGFKYKLITPFDRLLPFMIRYQRDATPQVPVSFKIYNDATGAMVADVPVSYLSYYTFDQYDYIVYKGEQLSGVDLAHGFYRAEIILDNNYKTLFSEVFWVDCDDDGRIVLGDFSDDFNDDFGPADSTGGIKKFTKLEWWNDCDLGNILYQTGYKNVLYIDTFLQRGEPEIIEEGNEDGKKDFIITSIKYIDTIKLDDYVPEYVLNALLLVKLHKNVLCTTPRNLYTGVAKDFTVNFEQVNDCYAKIDCNFKQQTTFLRHNCCNNNTITDQYACNIVIGNLIISKIPTGVAVTWSLQSGAAQFEIVSPQISAGAPTWQTSTTWSTTGWPPGTALNGYVRGRCINPVNGVVTFGNQLLWSVVVDSCNDIAGLVISGITDDAANATWTGTVGEQFEVTLFRSDTPGTPVAGYPQNILGPSHSMAGLEAGTDYNFSVRRICAGGTFGNWANMDFQTL